MIELKIDGQRVQVSGKGTDTEILVDSIAAIVALAYKQAEELQVKPQTALFSLYQLAAKYLNKVEAFAGDIGVKREDILTLFYNEILEIYNDTETEIIKEV